MPVIRGNNSGALITAERNTTIRGVHLDDAGTGVALDLGTAFQGLAGHATASSITIEDCKISDMTAGGIRISSTNNLGFGTGNARSFDIRVRRSFLSRNLAAAILSEVIGPATGTLAVSLNVTDNVLNDNSDGIRLRAEGRGTDTGQVRLFYAGSIFNNLIMSGSNGMNLLAVNGGEVGRGSDPVVISQNTISGNNFHGINAEAQNGASGDSRVTVALRGNIIANNGGAGYQEFIGEATPANVLMNLFFQNVEGHFRDENMSLQTAASLNSQLVNAVSNRVGNPAFVSGEFWFGGVLYNGGEGNFFLRQGGSSAPSVAVDAGPTSVATAGLANRSTRTDFAPDTGIVDIGFHYRIP
jgi:hypothetical protein